LYSASFRASAQHFCSPIAPAIITDVFPPEQRGFALGTNQLALVVGSVLGLILGGVLAVINWRIVFAVSIPFGLAGTLWANFRLRESARPRRNEKLDPIGNLTFGAGLILLRHDFLRLRALRVCAVGA
jgi:MFS family permease